MRVYYCEGVPPEISQHCLAYLLLETILKKNYFVKKPKYGYTEQGKPYLKQYPQLQFNISHCHEGVACAIGSLPVGIDIERRFPWKENLARRICHPAEWRRMEELQTQEERERLLNLLWSRKESWLKCIGIGLRCDLREINLLQTDTRRFQELQNERFTLVTCSEADDNQEDEIEKIRWQDLL